MFLVILVLAAFIYIFTQLTKGITRSSTCLMGKTALVTGANSGIGYQTALILASRGCKVIMADVADMQEAKNNIIKYTNNENIITIKIDLSSLDSVRNFAKKICGIIDKLDILINNAGIAACYENRTSDGLHPVMQINYFGHFLLTHLLIDLMKKAAPSRIIFTSSFMSFFNNLTKENLNYDNTNASYFSNAFIYCNSKLAVLIANDMFAKKLAGTGITVNSINPGIVDTQLLSQFHNRTKNATIMKVITKLYCYLHSKIPWEGAQVLVHVAISKKLENVTGKYFWDCKPFFKPFQAYNEKYCKEIWEASEELVRLQKNERLQ